jgi:hypothetical protein
VEGVLAQLEHEIEHHFWLRILDRSDPAHLEAQTLRARKSYGAYIADLLCIEASALSEHPSSPAATPRIARVRDLRPQNLIPLARLEGLRKSSARGGASTTPAPEHSNSGLDQIRKVTWQGAPIVASPSRRMIPGIATLRSGRKISMTVTLVKRPTGWLLTGRDS